ncbi:MAG TPA: S9 family peptidase [Myxococcales bacterium]|nr:S9 family peptidase [Myxococcales bacterium]
MILALALLTAVPVPAADVLRSLQSAVSFRAVTLSRDGRRVAWMEKVKTPDGPAADESLLYVQDLGAAQPRRITASRDGKAHDEDEPAFSPDGQSLAFLSDAARPHQPQLYVADLRTGKVRQLTRVTGHLEQPRFSPDGRTISVLYIEGGADERGPLMPASRQTGVVQEQIKEQRLSLLPADGSAPLRPLSPSDLFVYEYDWRPDGGGFALTAAHGSGEDNWWFAQLYTLDAKSGALRLLHKPAFQICEPTFSPDGKRIAFIEGLMSDAGANGGDIFVVPAEGGEPRDLTIAFHGTPATLHWIKPSEILFGLQIEGDSAFATVPVDSAAAPRILWRGSESIHAHWAVGASFSADGATFAAIHESFSEPQEIVAGALGSFRKVTQRNSRVRVSAGEARSIRWKSDDFDVQGWLLAPSAPAGAKAPMVVIVHGGPASAVRPSWNDQALLLASQGYFVFLPNPRGSFGQGEAFTRANVKDFGYGDLRDVLRGVDAVLASAPVDPARIGIYGHSYGGYMTMWAVTQTDRFRAAVASAGIASWQSYYGQNRIDQWMLPYFGKTVYDDPEVYARSSPITFIKKVKTPTLVLQGERDAEVPAPQAFEFWHALKSLGVETQLVVYADEGHHIRNPAHVRDRTQRIVGWFDAHLKAQGAN